MSDGKYRDSLFARLVLKEKLLPKDKVENLLKEVKLRQKKGESVTLSSLLVERGLIAESQQRELSRFLEKEIVVCPQCRAPYDANKYAEGKEFTCKKCGSKITIQKAFSDTFQTTIKFGAVPQDLSEEEFENLTKEHETSAPSDAPDFHASATVINKASSFPDEDSFPAKEVESHPEFPGTETEEEEEEEYEEEEDVTVYEQQDFAASSPSPKSAPSSMPVSYTEKPKEVVVLPKVASFQYYRKMNPQKLYPITVSFSPSDSKGVVRVRAQVPGGVTIPDYQDIVLSHPEPKADFWILTLAKQKTLPAQVQVWHEKSLATCFLPVKIVGRGMTKFFSLLFVLMGALIGYIFYAYSSVEGAITALRQYQWTDDALAQLSFLKDALKDTKQAGEYGLYLLAGLGGLFLLLTLIFCLVSKAKQTELNQGLKYE